MKTQTPQALTLAQLVYQKRQSLAVGEGRDAHPQSLRDAATEIGVSVSTLSRVETGSIPSAQALIKICRWLGVSVEDAMAATPASA